MLNSIYRNKPLYISILFLIISTQPSIASVTGKIVGQITDAETEEVLVGVNVVLYETTLGAASDIDGYYAILNVPPGTYTLKVSMIGYTSVTATNVVVVVDLTTTIDLELQLEILGMAELIVVAERPVVIPDVSASQLNINAKTMETMPVTDVNQVIGLMAGIQEGLVIRGSSSRQVVYIVDGIIVNDERSNIPYSLVSLNSINDVLVQSGGFNAEYGNVRSGIINIVTKEGSKSYYSGAFSFWYSPPAAKHFGKSVYDPNSFFLRPFMDSEVSYTGTSNGAWDRFTRNQYPSFDGWISVSDVTMKDNDPDNDLTPEAAKRLFEFQHRRQGDIKKPDYWLDIGFGGPIPIMSEHLGNLRFYASYSGLREMYIFPLSRDSYAEWFARLKLTADIGSSMKLTLTGITSETGTVSPYNWKTTPTGYGELRSSYAVANQVGSSSGNSVLYMPGWFSPSIVKRHIFGLELNRILSSNTYYTVYFQHNINDYNTYKTALRDTTPEYEIVPGYNVDEAPFGYWGYGVTGIDGMIIGGWMNLGRDKSRISTTNFRFNITTQLNINNEVRAGTEIVFNDFDIHSFTSNPGMSTWNRSQVYRVYPLRIEAYIQDKLEFKGFIANLGIRAEYSNSNTTHYLLDDYDIYYKEGYGNDIEEEVETKKSKPQLIFSPRLGVSYPITVNSKLYFNYGHFYTEPSSTFRFRLQREYNGLVTDIGDPNLERERTISYELGYSHNIMNQFLLNLAAYYKDITNQTGWIYFENINQSVQYDRAANNNYEDIRGLEITLEKRIGTWLTGFVNYTYMVNTSGYFGYTRYYEDPNKQREFLSDNPNQDKPYPRPYFRTNVDFHTPGNYGPVLSGIRPLGGWNLNVLANWTAGAYTTYNPQNKLFVFNNVQWKDTYNIDLRLTKGQKMGKYNFQFFVDIGNLLNTKFLSYAGFVNNFDYTDYMESLIFDWEEFGDFEGDDRIGEYREWDVEFIPLRTIETINEISGPEAHILYYDESTESYRQFENDIWVERSKSWVQKEVIDKNAYIDMPNLKAFTFLNPRDIKIGIRISF